MVVLNPALGAASVAYSVMVTRWVFVINRFHREVLEGDSSYEYKEHIVFKSLLFARALVLGAVAPVLSFFNPSYINQFIDGVKVHTKRTTRTPPTIGEVQPK
jgi:hypothetical protein